MFNRPRLILLIIATGVILAIITGYFIYKHSEKALDTQHNSVESASSSPDNHDPSAQVSPSDSDTTSKVLDAEIKASLPYFYRVDENYLRGAEPLRGGVMVLSRIGVKSIVDLRSKYDHDDIVGMEAERLGIRYFWIPMGVWDPPPDEKTAEFMSVVTNKQNGPLFVFCKDGINRVGMMTAIYRIQYDKWPIDKVIREMDETGFSPYYWSLRNYVWSYYRKIHPDTKIKSNHK